MKKRSRHGVTLLEVLAGAALLSLLAVSVVSVLRVAAAHGDAGHTSARVDELHDLAERSVAAAHEQSEGEDAVEQRRRLALRAEGLAAQVLRQSLPQHESASARTARIQSGGRTYVWLIVEAERLGAASFLLLEEEP